MKRFMKSSLWRQVQAITSPTNIIPVYSYKAFIHTPNQSIRAMKVTNIDYVQDPEQDYTSIISIELIFPAGDFFVDILPFREELEVTLISELKGEREFYYSEAPNINDTLHERYLATIFDEKLTEEAVGTSSKLPKDLLNISEMVQVKLQLVDKRINQLRDMTVGGSYRQCTAEEIIKAVLSNAFEDLELSDDLDYYNVDMVEASNDEVQEHFLIPQGTRLVDFPDYIQNESGGVYNSGLGSFISQHYWYIYPKYDVKRFDSTSRVVTIILIKEKDLPYINPTYLLDHDSLTILAIDPNEVSKTSELNELNKGDGVRQISAKDFLEEIVENKDNKSMMQRAKRAWEYITEVSKETKKDKPTVAYVAEDTISANPFKTTSELARNEGDLMYILWQFSNPRLLKPGTLLKIYNVDSDGELEERRGILMGLQHSIMIDGKVHFSNRFYTSTGIAVFLDSNYERDHLEDY